ncbi:MULTISPECIES: hypothetical protein [Flavobacterium]|uniref:hypothetical protein n=1 Tax=Flavobacterium TaxID=237 RepID=UPI001FCACF58|nr:MULTISPECIES: hypothetical protein [Flavobacterium]UOK42218.1 hypothetical protein LZF87_12975 [Flavobacterium enshiense]
MIDKERRKKLAYHLRHLSIGLITNDEFENYILDDVSFGWLPEQYYRAKEAKLDDPIIQPMLELSWCLYSSLKEYKLEGKNKLTNEQLKEIAKYILFLNSDNEYEWPYYDFINPQIKSSFREDIANLLSFGKYYKNKMDEKEKEFAEMQKMGDYDYWPFISKEQYEEQLKHQPFLTERKANA